MALESAKEIVAAATALSDAASAADDRLTEMLQAGLSDAQFLKMNVQVDKLYSEARYLNINAEDSIIKGLDMPQKELIGIIDTAKKEIEKIKEARKFLRVLASMIGFVGAVMGGQPVAIIGALGGISSAAGITLVQGAM